jgi:4-amino-4-deoxy-L-arabinose transferase-like glycosyltransferase
LILVLLLIGGALRFERLNDLPPRLSDDEYTTTSEAFLVLHGKGPPLFGLDWKPMPALTTHVTALLMRIVGPTILGVRLLSILLSLAAAILLFAILRWSCSEGVAWCTALVLLSNPWFLNFSRSGWENLHVATYWLLFTWCFFRGLQAQRRQLLYHLGAGAALALSFYGYFTGRLVFVVWLLFFPVAKAVSGRRWCEIASAYAIITVTALLLFAPQVPSLARRWEFFQQRVNAVSLFRTDPTPLGYDSRTALAAHQLWKTSRYLIIGEGIGNVHYSPSDRPPFHPALIPFLLVGMGRALVRWRVGLWWWLLVLIPIIATQGLSVVGDPNLARMAATSVGFFWFIGYGAGAVADIVGERWRRGVVLAMAAGALAVSLQEWRFFEQWMLSPAVASARSAGVDYQDYTRWQEIQFQRIASGRPFISVVEWDRPEVRSALLRGETTDTP